MPGADMGVGSIISNLINTGVQLYTANAQQGALKNAANAIQAAPYHPVDFTQEQVNTVKGNTKALPAIEGLDSATNDFITSESLKRAKGLIPNYTHAMQLYGNAASSLLGGQLPFDDVMGIVGDSSALAGSLGTPGGGAGVTLKDLGISRLGAIQSGGGMLKDMVNMAEEVSPVSRYATPQDMFVKPDERIPWDLHQAETIQQSDQGILNAAAQRAQLLAYAKNLPYNALSSASNTAVQTYNGGGGLNLGGSGGGGAMSYINGTTR